MGVIDTSVYVAMLQKSEVGHEESRKWFGAAQEAEEIIYAPGILLTEVAAAFSRGKHNRAMAKEAIRDLWLDELIELIPISLNLCQRAAVIAAEQKIRGCDAIYVALAEQLQTELVTLDRQQLERGAAVVPTRRPGE